MSVDPFITHRSLLCTVAYEMLGSASDAEDVVQETAVRWLTVDQTTVRDPRAFLIRIVTRKALDRPAHAPSNRGGSISSTRRSSAWR